VQSWVIADNSMASVDVSLLHGNSRHATIGVVNQSEAVVFAVSVINNSLFSRFASRESGIFSKSRSVIKPRYSVLVLS
jgi:hypothetical protein